LGKLLEWRSLAKVDADFEFKEDVREAIYTNQKVRSIFVDAYRDGHIRPEDAITILPEMSRDLTLKEHEAIIARFALQENAKIRTMDTMTGVIFMVSIKLP